MKVPIRASAAAERTLLGCVIAHPPLRHLIDLRREDFYDQRHGCLWDAIDGTADLAGLVGILDAKKLIDTAGGYAYVSSLADGISNPAQAPLLAQQIKQLAAQRRALRAVMPMFNGGGFDDDLTACTTALNELSGAVHAGGPVHVGDSLAAEVKRIKAVSSGEAESPSVMTGISKLDYDTGGLRAGQFVILAARPKVGKSAMALQIARHAAGTGKRVLFVSLEMAVSDLMCRLLASEIGGIPLGRLIHGKLIPQQGSWDDTSEADYVDQAEAKLRGLPLWFEYGEVGLNELRVMARTHQAKHGLDLVIVDYMGLMKPPQANSRYGEVSALSRGLKLLSGELGLPLLVVCQLNRNIEHDGGGRAPILSDLRDSGAIEQDADIVIFLHRSVVTEDQAEQEKTSLILAAQRNGPTDRFDIRYIGKFTRFVEGA